jgi:hypothetical protein
MTDTEALSTLLTGESFMLAVVSLTASLGAPGRSRVSALPVPPFKLALAAAGAVGLFALGAILAWSGMYVGGSFRPAREACIAVIILLAVLFQPVFALIVAFGVRTRR